MSDVSTSPSKVTASDIRAALLKHFAPPSHRVFFEVSNDTGTKASRWIDALAVGIWPSTGHEIIGIEIKVSRSDWQREMKDPAKAQSLMRFCTRWFLACPDGLVKPDELPATWGMLALKDGTIRTKVPAKLLEPEPLSAGFMMAVLRQANGVDMELVGKLVAERMDAERKQMESTIEREVQYRSRDVDGRRKRIDEVAEKLKVFTGEHPSNWAFDPQALAAAYRFMKASGLHQPVDWPGWDNIPGIISALGKAQQSLASLRENFLSENKCEDAE